MRFPYLFLILVALIAGLSAPPADAIKRPGVEFKIFQFPPSMIPRIDGNTDDWSIVPDSYKIGPEWLVEEDRLGTDIDQTNFTSTMKVGWVNGMNQLYFLYQATDNYWDFSEDSLHNDILELVVDADLSGGPFIKGRNPNIDVVSQSDLHFSFHGVHAQNYHIFTPPGDKDWTMVWGCAQWLKTLPFSNHAYSGTVTHGSGGTLTLEFWITPFDYAGYEGSESSIQSKLVENTLIGLGWVTIDYDGPGKRDGAYNITGKTMMFGDATDLCAFRLMPLEKRFMKPVTAVWTFSIIDLNDRLVAFRDLSQGTITTWTWVFGDNISLPPDSTVDAVSHERNPLFRFPTPGEKTVALTVKGPNGKDRLVKVWDVVVK